MARPVITAMIVAHTPDAALEQIALAHKEGAEAFGYQLESLQRKYHTREIFTELIKAADGKSVYVTDYRYYGNEGLSDDEIADELITLAECGASIIDIMGDLYAPCENQLTIDSGAIKKQLALIDKIHALGAKVLISSHTYKFADCNAVFSHLAEQRNRGADIAKLVTAANTKVELKANMETSAILKSKLGIPFLFLCIGEFCAYHRRKAPLIAGGMFLCVAEHNELTTLVQPTIREAKEIIKAEYAYE